MFSLSLTASFQSIWRYVNFKFYPSQPQICVVNYEIWGSHYLASGAALFTFQFIYFAKKEILHFHSPLEKLFMVPSHILSL